MIIGKVAALLDDRTLVINKGSDDGVNTGMRFMIYAAQGKKIVDPDSEKELGFLKLPKLSVEVTEVYPAYSKAETYKYRTVNEGGENSILGGLGGYLSPPKYVKKYETFLIEDHTKKKINEERSIVKVGDIAEEMERPEEEQ
jgi:hypothetical protein